jgi:hypothetical protein
MSKCPYCKEEVQSGATKCKHCGSKINRGPGCGTLILVVIIGFWIIIYQSSTKPKQAKGKSKKQHAEISQQKNHKNKNIINYQVYSGTEKFGQILVDSKVTRGEVIKLAKYLWAKYKGNMLVAIFNDKTALKNRFNQNYPTEKVLQHYLIEIKRGTSPDVDGIWWWKDGTHRKIR